MPDSYLDEVLAVNRQFVAEKKYEPSATSKYPCKKMAILACMDTRLTVLLPAALGLRNGDVVMIKTAGAMIGEPYGSVMRSLLIAIYELGVEDILVIAHHDCGMQGMTAGRLIEKMKERGIGAEKLEMVRAQRVDPERWLEGFGQAEDAVRETVRLVRSHPLVPAGVRAHGFVMDPETGRLNLVTRDGGE